MNYNDIDFNIGDMLVCYNYNNCISKLFLQTGIIIQIKNKNVYVLECLNNKYTINKIDYILKDYKYIEYIKLNINRDKIFYNNIQSFITFINMYFNNNYNYYFTNKNKLLRNLFYKYINIINNNNNLNYSLSKLLKNKEFDIPVLIINIKYTSNNKIYNLFDEL
jgi:hypothetical protein